MKRTIANLIAITLIAGFVTSCTTTVRRVRTNRAIDLSGRWNDTDSRDVAKTMVDSLLRGNWILKYRITEGNRPVIILGEIENRTSEHIDSGTFTKDIERELIESGRVKFVANPDEREGVRSERDDQQDNATRQTRSQLRAETGADVMLIGSMVSQIDQEGNEELRSYQIDLELIDIESNEKIWIDTHKIRKLVEKARISL